MKTISLLGLVVALFLPSLAVAVEMAPHITDREIVERLTRLEEGQQNLEKRMDDLRSEMNSRFSDMNSRFDTLQWMLGLFISIALVLFGFAFRMQWQMQRRQAHMETALETQKDELTFLKGLIHKLLPPKGVF